jgi:DNA-binding GntR family transcriptional regulator
LDPRRLNEAGVRAGNIAAMSRKSTATEHVAQYLRDAIVSGTLEPGQRIPQEGIAEACGTSRLPVREALHQLANEGLVVLTRNVGAQVAGFDIGDLNEFWEIRERLETLAIAKSAPYLTDLHIAQMEELQQRMEETTEPESLHVWLDLDKDFHFLTFAGASQPRLMDMVEAIWDKIGRYRRAYTSLPNRLVIAHLEHRLLLDALARRDPDDAERVLQMHIRRTRLALSSHYRSLHEVPVNPESQIPADAASPPTRIRLLQELLELETIVPDRI